MKNIALFLLLLVSSVTYGQNNKNVTVAGQIIDSLSGGLTSATVVLLNPLDSVISSFAITEVDGSFSLKRVAPGDYILQCSYISYVPLSKNITISGEKATEDLGPIVLEPVTSALDEILVKAERIPMEISKDSIIYNADAFKTKPNDVLADLLKKLPGVEVDADGTIKAQGEEVKQILVDGKEFFGKDPQIAAKNLPASAVSKVNVFNKKSDMAEFTGIDDGAEEKSINIELKDDHKKGLFGSATAGYGSDDRYLGSLSLNKFSKNQQISVLGMANNVNKQGFSMSDYSNFMGGMSGFRRRGGGGTLNGVPISNGLSNGYVNTGSGGINFNQDFSSKTKLNASYFYSNIKNTINQFTTTESVLSESSYLSEAEENEVSINTNHRINATLEHNFDSTQNLKVRSTVSFNDSELDLFSTSQVFNNSEIPQNSGLLDNTASGDNINFTSSATYRKKFNKVGRNITAEVEFGTSSDEQLAILESMNTFAGRDGMPSLSELISQDQSQTNDAINYGIQVSYSEPLGKNHYLNFEYERKNNSNEVIKDVYDIDEISNPIFNSLLSNYYNRDYVYDRGETTWRWIKSKSNLQVGVSAQNSVLQGEILSGEEANIKQSYFNFLPSLSWNYDLANSKSLRVSYNTSVQEPSLTQLQPIVDNSNPLKIYVGNPDLLQEYSHRLQVRYFSFSQFSMTNFFAMINATYTDNAIVNARTIDEQFRETSTPVNVDNDYRVTAFTGLGTPLRFMKSRLNLNGNYTYNKGRVFVNTVEENTNRYTTTIDLSLDNLKKDVIDIRVGTKIGHSITNYSASDNLDQEYVNQAYYTDINMGFAKTWNINTRFDYTVYNILDETQKVPLWEASLSKYIMNKKGEIKVSAFDILNKNTGIQQNIDLNYIEFTRVNSLARYFMLSFTYALNQMGAQSNSRGPGGFGGGRR